MAGHHGLPCLPFQAGKTSKTRGRASQSAVRLLSVTPIACGAGAVLCPKWVGQLSRRTHEGSIYTDEARFLSSLHVCAVEEVRAISNVHTLRRKRRLTRTIDLSQAPALEQGVTPSNS